eukprot:m.7811 g.7811  ORF g.7811 m.7811 type:complete len:305 (+) comp3780_c0_seq1:133-1047(+)
MEVEQGSPASEDVLSATASGSLNVKLHPLVLINASEHFTRVRAQTGNFETRVFGALLGVHSGRQAEVFNSFELVFEGTALDTEYLRQKSEQFKEVFPNLDFLGWYTNGVTATAEALAIHAQMTPFNETPLFMLLNTSPSPAARELPLHFYESVIEIGIDDKQKMLFVETGYTLATEEAERIGIDHVAKVKGHTTSTASEVTHHLTAQHSAVDMLFQRIKIIVKYLNAVKSGELPADHEVLREIRGICSRLPNQDSNPTVEVNDVLLVSYLATLTKGCNAFEEMLGKLSIVHDRSGARRGRPFFA